MLTGHNEPLELVDHLRQQVERLGVLFHAVCDHLCRCLHLLAKMANILSAVLHAGGHCLNGGPELVHAALFGELWMQRMLMESWLPLLVLCLLRLVMASIVTGSGRVVDHQGTQSLFQAFVMRSSLAPMLPARGGESADPLLPSGASSRRTRRCRVGSERVHPRTRRGSAGCRDVPRVSPCSPLSV